MKTAAAVTTLAALLLAGCGGGGPNTATDSTSSTSSAATPTPQAFVHDAYRFSACMRAHGLPQFPDPVVHSSAGSQQIGVHVTPGETSSPAFKAAQNNCQALMPDKGGEQNGPSPAEQQQRAKTIIALAVCLRAHGYPRFPDPNAQGDIQPQQITSAGINVHAPGFFNTAKSCLPVTHGAITVAQLAQAVNRVPAP